MTLFGLALRLKRLPSELAQQLTVDEFVDLIAFAEIEREELDTLRNGPPVDPEAEATKTWNALAAMAGPPPEDDPEPAPAT